MQGMTSSKQNFIEAFKYGLLQQSESNSLGNFILAMANASFDAAIYATLSEKLKNRFQIFSEHFSSANSQNTETRVNDEDRVVFRHMQELGFDELRVTEFRELEPWQLQFNMLRSFRPARMSCTTVTNLRQPFDASGFHFNRPFMLQEQLVEENFRGMSFSLYYNKYPFVPCHLLVVPDRQAQHEQFLTRAYHDAAWQWFEQLLSVIPDAVLGFNARGAFASVNHLHFQTGIPLNSLPVESGTWKHNGGSRDYPASCIKFSNAVEAWQYLESLHANNQTYNLVYSAKGLYCFPRRFQGTFSIPEWSAGISWYELAGGVILSSQEDFHTLTATQVENLLKSGTAATIQQS